jgi:sugar phosphate isomerase/epimerase
MAYIGFSTGALAFGKFREALRLLHETTMSAVEISALRLTELPILIESLPTLKLDRFRYVSVHAPSRFSEDDEDGVIELLQRAPCGWPIVVHPDTIHEPEKWDGFGSQLAIENMDMRKSDGRRVDELGRWFDRLPKARLCFDLAHAHQFDRTMTEAFRILSEYGDRICQLHISELDSTGHHFPLSSGSIQAFSEVASLIPLDSSVIIESLNPFRGKSDRKQRAWIEREAERASEALSREEVVEVGLASLGPITLSPSPVRA